jgi:hypothetical protein
MSTVVDSLVSLSCTQYGVFGNHEGMAFSGRSISALSPMHSYRGGSLPMC